MFVMGAVDPRSLEGFAALWFVFLGGEEVYGARER